MRPAKYLLVSIVLLCLGFPLGAAEFPCRPCAGLRLYPVTTIPEPVDPQAPASQPAPQATPADIAATLKPSGALEAGSPLFVAWEVPLSETPGDAAVADPGLPAALRDSGTTPWVSLVFRTPAPVTQNSTSLQAELRAAADFAGKVPGGAWFQIVWRPESGEFSAAEYAFLLKRAAVAVTGAQTDAKVATGPLPSDPETLKAFYGEDVAAYVEAVALQPAGEEGLAAAIKAVQELDPGRALVLDALPLPEPKADPGIVMTTAARYAAEGIDLTLFRAPGLETARLVPMLAPFALLAREFKGDLSYDPQLSPRGTEAAWTFVRGEDLSLRVIVLVTLNAESLTLRFSDPQLRRPVRFPIGGGQRVLPPSGQVNGDVLELEVPLPSRVVVLGLDRPTAAELQGVEEKVTVSGQRDMPVEEILRHLQAFEDAQARKLQHYSALNTTSLRFQPTAGTVAVEATLEGPFFYDPETGADWAWQTLYINGVKWRNKTLPEIPLIQPEKAAALPLAIHFTKQYRYRLRGSETVDGRDAWVIDFAPAGPSGESGKLYQGSVWVDKQLYARLRTRAVQIGLEGEVLSNEETLYYSPVDANGAPVPWSAQSYVLPLRLVAQQILSVVNAATVVERETLLTNVQVNGPGFEESRKQVADSEVTMVRDTDKGLRYLVKNDQGDRVVKEGFDTNKLFAAGGVFYDDALDYPLPLAGINYLSFDFRGTGKQLNLFFAGALLTANMADPRLFGSKFDAGADLFVLAVPTTDTLYQDGREVNAEDVEQRVGTVGFKLGRPLGNFVKLNAEYEILSLGYSKADDTVDEFVVPSDNFIHSFELSAAFARSGYRLAAGGSYNRRSEWEPWGLPGNPDFSEEKRDFLRWEVRASKNWYLPSFQRLGLELGYSSGSDLDRFSKYQFGFFGSNRVHGYQSGLVRATEVFAGHASYGFEIGKAFRLDGLADVALATDEDTGLDRELLSGLGIQGTFMGPWQTIVNLDVGVPVAGPDDGFVLYLVFLKLFK